MSLLIRWQWREWRAARGRWAALLLAMTLSVAAVVALAQARERLDRAMLENYLATAPAHAQLPLMPGFDAARLRGLLAELTRRPGIEAARLSMSASTRVSAPGMGRWLPALLFSLPDPSDAALAHGRAASGAWPGVGEAWVERDTARVLGKASVLELPDGTRLTITGSQHDPALAPAAAEGVVYAYVPTGALTTVPGLVAQSSVLLRFAGVEAERDQARADAAARQAAAWLQQQGIGVLELRVPPVAEHPHQRQAEGAAQMLLACSLLATVLCAVTAAALLRGWLDTQRHPLGVLKVLGAGRGALVASTLALVASLTGMAALTGALLGLGLGEALALVSADLLNLQLPGWHASKGGLAAGLGVGLLLPLVSTARLIWRWAGQPPAEAMAERDVHRYGWLDRLPLPGPLALRLATRNVLRRRRRFVLSSTLLAVAGAVFMGGVNLRAAWEHLLDQGAAQRLYQVELRFAAPAGRAALAPLLQATPEVRLAEAWNTRRATWVNEQGVAVSRAYPDGGHGQLLLRDVPPRARLQHFAVVEGHWLDDDDGLVINQAAAALLGRPARVGELLNLVAGDTRQTARLVGRIEEPMSPPTVYHRAPADQPVTHWRLALVDGSDPVAVAERMAAAAARLGLPGVRALTERDLRRSAVGHLLMLQRVLAWVALGTGLVGVVALASALGSSVVERQRELAVLNALGASSRLLRLTVMGEALLVVSISVALAFALGFWLLDPLLAARLGEISGQPLRTHAAGLALPLWALLASAGGLLASVAALRAATRCRRA